MKYACIAQYQREFTVRLMCGLLQVSPSGFYAAQQRQQAPLKPRAAANARLAVEIRAAHAAAHGRYGAPRIQAQLAEQGVACGRHRVARLLRVEGLRGLAPRRFRVTTQSGHREPVAPNVVARRFAPSAIGRRDAIWAADITYLPTGEGWLYLAVVLDVGSRRVLGWCADRRLDQGLALEALRQAVVLRQPPRGLIHHSDRGVQYASAAYRGVLEEHDIVQSMSGVGNCWDNAVVESFFATLKLELLPADLWPTRAAGCRALAPYIDVWYNHQRRHSALGYRSPVQYERDLAQLRSA